MIKKSSFKDEDGRCSILMCYPEGNGMCCSLKLDHFESQYFDSNQLDHMRGNFSKCLAECEIHC